MNSSYPIHWSRLLSHFKKYLRILYSFCEVINLYTKALILFLLHRSSTVTRWTIMSRSSDVQSIAFHLLGIAFMMLMYLNQFVKRPFCIMVWYPKNFPSGLIRSLILIIWLFCGISNIFPSILIKELYQINDLLFPQSLGVL